MADECISAYSDLKRGAYRYVIYKISQDNTNMVVEKTNSSEHDKTLEMLLEDLPEADCRFAVIDFRYDSGTTSGKYIFLQW